MAKSTLYEYVILFHPKQQKDAAGNDTTAKSEATGVKTVVAGSDKEVGMVAAREIPEQYLDKLDQVEILIRPFA